MTHPEALQVLEQARKDKRITAQLISKQTSRATGNGYQVKLVLRGGHRVMTIGSLRDWQDVVHIWEGL